MNKTDFKNKPISFNRKITSNITKYLKGQKKVNSITTKTYTFFDKIYFKSNNWSLNTFVYQLALDTLELKKDNGTDYVLSWKLQGVFNSKLKSLYTAFLYGIYHSGFRIRNVSEFIVNVYIVYYLDAWPINPPNNFKFKNCLFGGNNRVTKIVE